MRAERQPRPAAEAAPGRRLRPRLVARRALDRVRDGPQRPARAVHDPHDGRGLRQVASRAADPRAIDWQPRGGDPVIAAAGDIACDPDLTRFATGLGTSDACHMLQTSDLLMKMDLSAVLPLGDLQYENGTLDKFQRSFDPDLGAAEGPDAARASATTSTARRAPRATSTTSTARASSTAPPARATRATTPTTSARGTSWRSTRSARTRPPTTRTGNDCAAGSPQEQWLRADLAAHPARCTLAAWHHPLVQLGPRGLQRRGAAALPGALRRRRRGRC